MAVLDVRLEEDPVPGKPLGRHVELAEGNLAYPMAAVMGEALPLRSKSWWRPDVVFDQGSASSCTWQATGALIITSPARLDRKPAVRDVVLNDQYRHDAYLAAQQIDPWAGGEPTYYGTSCRAAMQIAKDRGLIDEYRWALGGLDDALQWLAHKGPLNIGITWYPSFDTIPATGVMPKPSGTPRGGHAMEVYGINITRRDVSGVQSWGRSYGRNGYWRMSWDTFGQLLADNGEAVGAVLT